MVDKQEELWLLPAAGKSKLYATDDVHWIEWYSDWRKLNKCRET